MSIQEQAQNYAKVITGQIAGNFKSLDFAVRHCPNLKKAQEEYKALKTQSANASNNLALKSARDKVEMIADSIGDVVCDEYNSVEPLVVGLFGEWGSGKTHQLKLIKKEILTNKEQFSKTTIPVFFNVWRFEKEEHIILPLFETLLDTVESHERTLGEGAKQLVKSKSMHIKNLIYSLKDGLNISSAFKTLKGVYTGDVEDLVELANIIDTDKVQQSAYAKTNTEQVGDQNPKELLKPDELRSIYLNIPKWIEKITLFEGVNFVFLIDDLDRCLPENTLKMLESIKLFLDVPSCAFVLAIDDDVVERGVVHHYRDYLSIYHNIQKPPQEIVVKLDNSQDDDNKEEETPYTTPASNNMTHELPITGHEYLEKMVQLPMRLPVMDEANAKEFLQKQGRWIAMLDEAQEKENKDRGAEQGIKEKENPEENKVSDEILEYFSHAVPPKPRKLKRTAKLFESKLALIDAHKFALSPKPKLVAKMTLLELFAPKILRFLQNNDYAHSFKALHDFHYVVDSEVSNSLHDTQAIHNYIENNADYTTEHKNRYHRLAHLIEEHHSSRVMFDLSKVFDTAEEEDYLKLVIEMSETKRELKTTTKPKAKLSSEIMKQLFLEDNVASWGDVLRKHNEQLSQEQLDDVITKAKTTLDKKFNNLPFIANPEWVGEVAKSVSDEDYLVLLKASHDARFKSVNGEFEVDAFEVTYAEYDRYVEMYNRELPKGHEDEDVMKKPKDRYGRGRRPVTYVNYKQAEAYIMWLDNKLDIKYKLPTKDEWEKACNNGKTLKELKQKWHFGDNEKKLKEYAWYDENSDSQTHRVGELKPNELGLYDMHGNVWEWYESDENVKTIKGGSFFSFAVSTHTSFTNRYNPSGTDFSIGFRLLRTLP